MRKKAREDSRVGAEAFQNDEERRQHDFIAGRGSAVFGGAQNAGVRKGLLMTVPLHVALGRAAPWHPVHVIDAQRCQGDEG